MKSALLFFLLAIGCLPPISIAPDSDTDVAQRALDSTVKIETGSGHGSGFFVGDGVIATAAHVMDHAPVPRITTRDGQECTYERSVLSADHDLAIVHVTDCQAPALPLGEEPLEGDRVWLAGSPYYHSWSITTGIVSDADEGESYILDVQGHPGMSGGPAVNSDGHVIALLSGGLCGHFGCRIKVVPTKYLAPYLD